MKKKLIIIGSVILTICIIAGVMLNVMGKKQDQEMATLNYQDVDMDTVEDGNYIGEAETTLIKVTVEVAVADHQITEIKLTRHDNGKGKAAEVIVNDIKEQNRCDVDVISGATYSSKVIKSAVRNALLQGIKK